MDMDMGSSASSPQRALTLNSLYGPGPTSPSASTRLGIVTHPVAYLSIVYIVQLANQDIDIDMVARRVNTNRIV